MNQKIVSFDKEKSKILDNKLKKKHKKQLNKIALTSSNPSEYAIISSLYRTIESGNRIINDSEKRAKCKKIYRQY